MLDQARLPTPLCHCILQTLPPSLPNTEHILQVGPSRLLLEGESSTEARDRLHTMLAAFPAAPFSYQRLAELLLEPRKQYSQLHKLVRCAEGSQNAAVCQGMPAWLWMML